MTDLLGPGNAANSVTSEPSFSTSWGSSDTYFQNCTSSAAQNGTTVTADWLNLITTNLRGVARINGYKLDGVTPVLTDANVGNQAATAVQYLIQRGAVGSAADSGTANAATVALNPPPPEVIAGMPFLVKKIAAQNTGAMTFNGVALTWADGSALQAGDWPASTWAEVVCAAATSGGGPSAYVLLSVMGPSVFARKTTTLQLIPSTTFYVNASTGNDSNPGTSALPFLTGQGAFNYISQFFSASGVTVNFAAGTYAGFNIKQSLIPSWNLVGAGASSTTISATTTSVNGGTAVGVSGSGVSVTVSGFTLTAYYYGIGAFGACSVTAYSCNFVGVGSTSTAVDASSNSQVSLLQPGASTSTTFNVSGLFGPIFFAGGASSIQIGYYQSGVSTNNVTINFGTTTGALTISVNNDSAVILQYGYLTWSGSTPTAGRYQCANGGGISGYGGGYTFIPGTVAGSPNTASVTSTGGWYAP